MVASGRQLPVNEWPSADPASFISSVAGERQPMITQILI